MTLKHLSAEDIEEVYSIASEKQQPWNTQRIYTANISLRDNNGSPTFIREQPKPPQAPTTIKSYLANKHSKKKKQVRFGSVYKCTYRQRSPSRAERKALWYSGKEIRDMRTAICALNMTTATMDDHQHTLLVEAYEKTDTWRGLEHVREGSLVQKVEHRRNFVQAFLYFCHELGVSNPTALGVFSSTNSQVDRIRAIDVAKQDAMDACQIYYAFLTVEKHTPEARAAERDGERRQQTTPKGRRQRRQSKATPRHHAEKQPFQTQVYNLTLSL